MDAAFRKRGIVLCVLAVLLCAAVIFCKYDYGFYKKTIATVTAVTETVDHTEYGARNIREIYYRQKISAVIKNGKNKGESISFTLVRSESGVNDEGYRAGNDVFVSFSTASGSWSADGFKRDVYVVSAAALFIFAMAAVGRKKGFLSMVSVLINIIVFTWAIDLYLRGINILIPCIAAVVFFSAVSLLIFCGWNRKTGAAVLATLIGTGIEIGIALIVIAATGYSGVVVESMQFLLTDIDYTDIFIAELLIGGLGAIMDIAITMSASMQELMEKNPDITTASLIKSGKEIGKDVMGTMTNVLLFTCISGSIPMMLLMVQNGIGITAYMQHFASIEFSRFLTGSIGLVVTIPIGLLISIRLLRKGKRTV